MALEVQCNYQIMDDVLFDLFSCEKLPIDNFEQSVLSSGYKSKTINSSKSTKADLHTVVQKQEHLNGSQKKQLYDVSIKCEKLFDGKLGMFTDYKISLQLKKDAVPKASKAYPVPRHHLEAYKAKLDASIADDALEKAWRSEWIAGSFIVPKRDTSARWVSDFRALNMSLVRKIYPMPYIQDIITKRPGYKYVTLLDLTDHYYTFVVRENDRYSLTIATPFGLFRYKRLPQGMCIGPDVAQEAMENLLREFMEWLSVYFDDIAIFGNSWDEHSTQIDQVCARLLEKGFKVNPNECFWIVQEVPFLGHIMTPLGVKPMPQKVCAIQALKIPENLKQLRGFLGLVTHCRDVWKSRSHILAPLTDLLGTERFKWSESCTTAFHRMKARITEDTLLICPDHNRPFHIETDASDFQLGGAILQKCLKTNVLCPVAFHSRELNSAQKNYTTIEKELLSVAEILKAYRTILLGSTIIIHTDHKNLSHAASQCVSQRVLRWRLLLEIYGPTILHKRGQDNILADALSRAPTDDSSAFGEAGTLNEEETDTLFFSIPNNIAECLIMGLVDDDAVNLPTHDMRTLIVVWSMTISPEMQICLMINIYNIQFLTEPIPTVTVIFRRSNITKAVTLT